MLSRLSPSRVARGSSLQIKRMKSCFSVFFILVGVSFVLSSDGSLGLESNADIGKEDPTEKFEKRYVVADEKTIPAPIPIPAKAPNIEIKSIIDIQPYKISEKITILQDDGKTGEVELINLNSKINSWYILKLRWHKSGETFTYHLENLFPQVNAIKLDASYVDGIVIENGNDKIPCPLWSRPTYPIREARFSKKPFAPICEKQLFLRNKIDGHRSTKEWITDFLRDHVWGGERITSFFKSTFFKDHFLIQSESSFGPKSDASKGGAGNEEPKTAKPLEALVGSNYRDVSVEPTDLGIEIEEKVDGKIRVGKWYPVKDIKNVYISTIKPSYVENDIYEKFKSEIGTLDNVEKDALVYSIAFDLDFHELGFSLGTDHPRVDWSDRTLEKVRNRNLPGPDGIGDVAPLVPLGLLNSKYAKRVISTFTGGFKRSHAAFKWGDLALKNFGSHYGFIEHGVLFSKLQPGLATFVIKKDKSIVMKTWQEEDNAMMEDILHARQNGVAVLDIDEVSKETVPGKYVRRWAEGNWSGSQDSKFRTLRAGVCMVENGTKRYLVYTYFSSVTPPAMSLVFLGYRCSYAQHLDMNAMEHTYLSLFRRKQSDLFIEHLISGMNVLDGRVRGLILPRFVGIPDNRDFFYVMKRERQVEEDPSKDAK